MRIMPAAARDDEAENERASERGVWVVEVEGRGEGD